MAASTPSLGLFKLLRLASTLPRPASCYAICPGFCHSNGKHKESWKDQKHSNCQIELCQPDQLALSAPDHRAARQLREKVLSCLTTQTNSIWIKWIRWRKPWETWSWTCAVALGFAQLWTSRGRRSDSREEQFLVWWIVFKVLGKLLPGLESGRTGNGGRGVTGEHLQVSFWQSVFQNSIPCQNVIFFSIWPPTQELQRMSASHRLVGFPLHFAYSDTEAIAEGVRGTGVHLCRYSHLFSFDKCHIPFFLQGARSWVCTCSAGYMGQAYIWLGSIDRVVFRWSHIQALPCQFGSMLPLLFDGDRPETREHVDGFIPVHLLLSALVTLPQNGCFFEDLLLLWLASLCNLWYILVHQHIFSKKSFQLTTSATKE